MLHFIEEARAKEMKEMVIKRGRCTNGINIAPVGLNLRVLQWITIDLAGAGEEESGPHSLGQA